MRGAPVVVGAVLAALLLPAGIGGAADPRPRIVSARVAETYFDPTARRPGYTIVSILFRTCTTIPPETLRATVRERLSVGGTVKARRTFAFTMPRSYTRAAGCVFYRVGWRQAKRFAGPESYVVSVQVRDGYGSTSNTVSHQFIHETGG